MIACSVEKPKKLSWWPKNRAGIRNGIRVAESFGGAILMKVGLYLKVANCGYEHICHIWKTLRKSENLTFISGENALLALPLAKANLKVVADVYFCFICLFWWLQPGRQWFSVRWITLDFGKRLILFVKKPHHSDGSTSCSPMPAYMLVCCTVWQNPCQVLMYPRNKAMGLNLGMRTTQSWVVIEITEKSLSKCLGQKRADAAISSKVGN